MIVGNQISCGVVILAAGDSSRMGKVKYFLRFSEKKLFIEKIIDEYLDFECERIVVVKRAGHVAWDNIIGKYSGQENVCFINNDLPELERFYSLKLGIELLGNLNYCFIQNSDNPFVSQSLLGGIYCKRDGGDFVVPTFDGSGGHPILIGKKIINELSLHKEKGNLKELLKDYKRFDLETNDENILVNINRREDYQEIFERKFYYA